MNKITRIGLDIAKNIFVLHAVNEHGKTVKRQTLDRSKVLECFANIEPCLVGIESCASSQHWAREISQFGHTVKLMNPKFVVPTVKAVKTMPTMRKRFVRPWVDLICVLSPSNPLNSKPFALCTQEDNFLSYNVPR
jgi:transposase